MKKVQEIKSIALKAIETESISIAQLSNFVDNQFVDIVNLLLKCKGRLIVAGIGKSANIAQKLVSTFNSTGQPSIFLHAADAIHGDLGNVQSDDVVLFISKSGNTPEIKALVPLVNSMGNTTIAMTGNLDSFLSNHCNFIINVSVEKEACPNNLAPTSSTTAQLVMGDALAICLLECRGFNDKDFAKYHPGGSLGKRLFLKIGDLSMRNEKPQVKNTASIQDVIVNITEKRLGATVVTKDDNILGIITDGDIRRMLENKFSFDDLVAIDIMTSNPIIIQSDELAFNALKLMEEKNISQIVVVENKTYLGIVHIHDILKEGVL